MVPPGRGGGGSLDTPQFSQGGVRVPSPTVATRSILCSRLGGGGFPRLSNESSPCDCADTAEKVAEFPVHRGADEQSDGPSISSVP